MATVLAEDDVDACREAPFTDIFRAHRVVRIPVETEGFGDLKPRSDLQAVLEGGFPIQGFEIPPNHPKLSSTILRPFDASIPNSPKLFCRL